MTEETRTAECFMCGHAVRPHNPEATRHLCRTCLRFVQVGDRVE